MKLFLITFFMLTANAFGCELNLEQRRAPVWFNGQAKSFQIVAKLALKKMSFKLSLKEASELYCLILTKNIDELNQNSTFLESRIKFLEEINRLPSIVYEANQELQQEKKDSLLKKYEMIKFFREAYLGKQVMVYDREWMPLITKGNMTLFKLKEILNISSVKYNSKKYLFENHLYEFKLFGVSLALLFFAFLIKFIPWKYTKNTFITFSVLSLLTQAFVVLLRVLYMDRAPIANMYETVLLSAPLSMLLGFVFIRKNFLLLQMSFFYALCCLGTLAMSDIMLDEEMKNIMPVLRDNFWLSTHVTSIVFSYCVLAISWGISNYVMVSSLFGKSISLEDANHAIRFSITYGNFFLFSGILLGAIWADYSWGRFWAWDPKETWSLISFLVYMVVLHGIRAKKIKSNAIYIYVALAFLSVLMAWFGVNYILSTGLHSYGFSLGGANFLISIVIVQIIIITLFQYKKGLRHENYS
jgi:ABC-type transport system involved in cytochrome c biogenesis permease subunit